MVQAVVVSQGGAEGGKGGGHKQLEGSQLGADVHDLGQPVAAGVVDQLERLDQVLSVVVLASSAAVVVVDTGVEVL